MKLLRVSVLFIGFFLVIFATSFFSDFIKISIQHTVIPLAYAANNNLFVSAENSIFNNTMSGPQVIEVVVIDSNINDVNSAQGEPDVTVNGRALRMVQAVDGNWYGYFADRNMALIADSTTKVAGVGLDFGQFCSNALTLNGPGPLVDVDFHDTAGVAIPGSAGASVDGGTVSGSISAICGTGVTSVTKKSVASLPSDNNVIREAKALSTLPNSVVGQIDIPVNSWPFIQLYTLNPNGNVVVQYNKGGGVQTATLVFDTVDQFVKLSLDRTNYTQGAQIHADITDPWLNVDPTDEDSWTFETVGDITTNYQVFDENGGAPGAVVGNVDTRLLTDQLPNLMCGNNCVLKLNPDVQNTGFVVTLQDNADSQLTGDPIVDIPFNIGTIGGSEDPTAIYAITGFSQESFPSKGSVPITFTEQGANSGIFSNTDESDKSNLRITNNAKRGATATLEYNSVPVTIPVSFSFATIDLPINHEWSSGEEIPISLVDGDANKNSRVREDLDLNNPDVKLIPSLKIGLPNTLARLTSASIDGFAANFTVQKFSDRALLTTNYVPSISAGDELVLTFGTMADVFKSTPIDKGNFHGFILFNYDVRALANPGNILGLTNVDITLAGVTSNIVAPSVINTFDNAPLKGLILLNTDSFKGLSSNTPLVAKFAINGVGGKIPYHTVLPVVADIFGFGFTNDGREKNERFANQIIRPELKETGDNTGTFVGTLEYKMINQLNILDSSTYTDLITISDKTKFIVMDDLEGEDAPRINYNDLGADGVTTQVSDQKATSTHSGIVSFTNHNGVVTVELKDSDLNVDNDLIDVFTAINNPSDSNFDVVGDSTLANGGTSIELSNGDQLGRLLDVTFDDLQWKTPPVTSSCKPLLEAIVGTNTGLSKQNFSLTETSVSSGIFVGDFQVPSAWCRPDATTPESVTGLDMQVNYVDFRDKDGKFIEVDPPDKYELKLDSGSFTFPSGNQTENIIGNKTATEKENFFFLQTNHYLDPYEIKHLADNGITLVDFLNGYVYVASSDDVNLRSFPFESHPEIRSVIPIEPSTKRDSNLFPQSVPPWVFEENIAGFNKKVAVTIFFHKQMPYQEMTQILSPFNATVGSTIEGMNAVSALMSFDQIENLLKHSAVKFIQYQDPQLEPEIVEAKRVTNISQITNIDSSLEGNNVVVLIFDNSAIQPNEDFGERLFSVNSRIESGLDHATHIAGVLGGGGIINNTLKGVAPKVKILSYGSGQNDMNEVELWAQNAGDLEGSFKDAYDLLGGSDIDDQTDPRIDLMNISLGQPTNKKGWDCKFHGNYTATSRILDLFVHGYSEPNINYNKIIITKSAGNEGVLKCFGESDYNGGFGTIASPATAKNPIVVGSIDSDLYPNNKPDVISSFSSVGPTDDGRIKPDLVAPGAHDAKGYLVDDQPGGIISISKDEDYTTISGTSIASPIVGGIVALMEEKWEQKYSTPQNPQHLEPHQAKAILIHTAEDLGKPGPDFKYGWGLVNGENAIKLINDSVFLNATNNSISTLDKPQTIIQDSFFEGHYFPKKYTLNLSKSTDLKLTLVWDDPPSSIGTNSPELWNDLDLKIFKSNEPIAQTFVLDKNNPGGNAGVGPDRLNNVEMINATQVIGNLEILVEPFKFQSLVEDPTQDFTLIVSANPTTSPPSEPEITLSPTRGPEGTPVIIEGSGFESLEQINFKFGNDEINIPPIISDFEGKFITEFIVPSTTAGTKSIIASGLEKTATKSFIIPPLVLTFEKYEPKIKFDTSIEIRSKLITPMPHVTYSITTTTGNPNNPIITEEGIFKWTPGVNDQREEPYIFKIKAETDKQSDEKDIQVIVVPEFGTIAIVILVVSITCIIALTKTRLIQKL